MHKEIYVAGYPSFHGGADTELAHQIKLWRMNGVSVVLVPLYDANPAMKAVCDQWGCKTRAYKPGIFKDRIVVSFCNGEFLKLLPEIRKDGRPRATIWANCMTWTFPNEEEAHARGWIDYHLFQSDYQESYLMPKLQAFRPVRKMPYLPFYDLETNPQRITFLEKSCEEYFGLGRISRDDQAKYPVNMWNTFRRVRTPGQKKIFILGFGQQAYKKCGPPPPDLDWAYWGPGGIPARELYEKIHVMLHATGGSRENLPRVMMEAWHSGTILVCENDYGFREYVQDGVTGFLCNSADEMAMRASQLAFDPDLRKRMAKAAHQELKETFGNSGLCWKGWEWLFGQLSALPQAQAVQQV